MILIDKSSPNIKIPQISELIMRTSQKCRASHLRMTPSTISAKLIEYTSPLTLNIMQILLRFFPLSLELWRLFGMLFI